MAGRHNGKAKYLVISCQHNENPLFIVMAGRYKDKKQVVIFSPPSLATDFRFVTKFLSLFCDVGAKRLGWKEEDYCYFAAT